MIAIVLLLIVAGDLVHAQSQATKDQAQVFASIGRNELHLGRLSEAQSNCDAALKLDPANETAKDCLDSVAAMLIDQDLNNADGRLLIGDKPGAIALASKWVHTGTRQDRASRIITSARSSPHETFKALTPDWLRQVLVTIVTLSALALFLRIARRLWSEWERGKWFGNLTKQTTWSLVPLKEFPATADLPTGMATDAVLDALSRLGPELGRKVWNPKLLLLRPTPPADYEPAIITDFLSNSLPSIMLAPAAPDLCLEWELHDVQLDQAVQNLQLKTATGIDIGSVARFIRSIVQWFSVGAPTISGIAQTGADRSVSIQLAARGGRINSVAITASTDYASGIDPAQLSAERAAFKFLFRMRYPSMTNDEIDGFSALRQGAAQFRQFAGTVPGIGEDAKRRTSSLAKAAFNLSFFRASIPLNATPCSESFQGTSLDITDDVRQSILLAEGVTNSLLADDENRTSAIDCFRQLEDWPGSVETEALRQQAAYNEAIVWRQLRCPGRCVLMLTELLGERAPDTISSVDDTTASASRSKSVLPDAIRFPARLARLAAFAQYNRDDWTALPPSRAELLINDAEKLVEELDVVCNQSETSAHDRRLGRYMHTEALRSIGHVELLRVIAGPASSLYRNNRPTGLMDGTLNQAGTKLLTQAISRMLTCEQFAPSCGLYCDLAEAYLLLKDFSAAEGYARHATLESNPYNERAYYIATETFFIQNTEASRTLATKYAEAFKGPVVLEQFKSVRAALGISERAPTDQVS